MAKASARTVVANLHMVACACAVENVSRVAGPRGTRVVCRRAPSPPRAPTRRALGRLKLVVRPPGCGSPAPAILGLLSDRRRR